MKNNKTGWGFVAIFGLCLAAPPLAAAQEAIYLHQIPVVRGIIFAGSGSELGTFLVGTAHGPVSVAPDGQVKRLSDKAGVLSALVAHPTAPGVLFSSGYRSKSEKLGVIRSDDGGRTWARISRAADGPVAFHAMAIDAADPAVMYGVAEAIHVSRDSGKTWTPINSPPAQVFDIAVSGKAPKTLYAATREGLFRSLDDGVSWVLAHPDKRPAPIVRVTEDGRVFTFLYGLGLMVREAQGLNWTLVSDQFADRALLDFAIDPANPQQMLAAVDTGAVVSSRDGGKNWISFEGQLDRTPARVAAGERLFNKNCQACHGTKGIGEKPGAPDARDEGGLPLAPAMDDSAHAWHHPDAQIIATILNGSPRNPRMAAWKNHGLTRDDAQSLVAYIKSLWNFRSLACQGSRHMRCMQ